jgi:hypothetical protein
MFRMLLNVCCSVNTALPGNSRRQQRVHDLRIDKCYATDPPITGTFSVINSQFDVSAEARYCSPTLERRVIQNI